MRSVRVAALFAGLCVVASLGCGKKGHSGAGHAAAVTPAPPPPTPDNTPVASLRTPAGWLLLKTEPPAPTPAPAASPASNPSP
ncbi:MAG: hypothetical protein ACRD3M_04715 [Thermoanaerobaculia bacterium]